MGSICLPKLVEVWLFDILDADRSDDSVSSNFNLYKNLTGYEIPDNILNHELVEG